MNKREFLKGSAAVGAAAMMPGMAKGQTHVPRENWSGTFHYHTDKVFEPKSVADVQAAVRSVASVRALGSRHSFNGIADSTSAQISTLGLRDVKIDAATKTVTVGAGIKYGDLAVELDRAGWALANLASLPHITVGGSVATATHGSGLGNGNLATAVRAVEFVAADGTVHVLRRGDAEFAGAVVGLGALGVVTHLTLAIEPTYNMTQIVYRDLNFRELEHNFEAVMSAGYSVSLFTNWQKHEAWEVWIKRRLHDGKPVPAAPTFFGATLSEKKLHPVVDQDPEKTTEQLNTVGKWYERLPHFKMEFTPSTGHEIQTEYFVPFEHAYAAVEAVESLRDQITPHIFVTELRAVAADDLWMSMAYERRSLAIHFTWKPEWDAVLRVIPQIEAKLLPFAPRPHWAKVNTLGAAHTRKVYPKLAAFEALRKKLDPQGKFVNAYLHEKVLG